MKTLYTTYNNFAKRITSVLFFLTVLTSAWAATGTLSSISTRNGSASDSQGNTWSIASVGTISSTAHGEYFQIGSANSPATSITFTMTLPTAQSITAFNAKFSGYSAKANVTLRVDNTIVGEGAIQTSNNTSNPVTISSSSTAVGTTLTVSVTNISGGGVNFYNLSYTYESTTTHEVTWIVDGSEVMKGDIPEGILDIGKLPNNPANCSSDVVFVGWTNSNVDGNKPADLFNRNTPNNLPIISSSKNTFYAVYATQIEAPEIKIDALDKAKTGVSSSYTNWSEVSDQSSAVYAGYTAGGNSSIQLNNDNQGIITTTSGGKATKVVVAWNNNTKDDRTLNVYGKSTAYSKVSDLYDSNQGTLLGTIVKGKSTELTISGDYQYIGLRSESGAMYITSISITWKTEGRYENYTTSCSSDVTITLNPNGGTGNFEGWDYVDGNYTKTVEKDQPVTLPTLNDQIAYTFGGWYDENDTKIADGGADYTPEADITLYAQWTPKSLTNFRTLCTYDITYTETYDVNHENPNTYTVKDLPLTFKEPTTKREGYTFKAWSPTGLDLNTRGNQEVEAQWTANKFKVIFDANGGDGTMADQPFTYDVEQPLTKNTYTKTGYTFTGWNDNKNGTGPSYADQEVVKNLSTAANGRRTLYAQWTANTNTPYAVKHYKQLLDGKYSAEADETENLTGTTDASVTPTTKTYDGFTSPSQQTVTVKADGTLVVEYYYTRNSYILTWDYAGGSVATEGTAAGSVKFGAVITAPTLTKTGYNFAGWSPEEPTTMPAANSTYTAQWNLITYTVNWMLGDVQYVDPTTVSVETPLTLPTAPANDALGCCANAFVGWSIKTNPTKADVFNDLASAPTIDGHKTFHAVFATSTLTSGSATATFNEMGYANAEKVTEIALGDGEGNGDATIVFDKEQSGTNYAAYYSASSALHAYAKNTITINSTSATSTITNVQFTFATKNDGTNTITADVGTYADGIWTGSAESVVFTIDGTTGHRKITSITVTTESVEKYTNYTTQCDQSANPVLGNGSITYNSGSAIDVKCGKVSAMNTAATLSFPDAAELTCPVTLTVSDGFLISTSKSNDAGYKPTLTISPYKQGSSNPGKLRPIYIRANAEGKTVDFNGTITITGGEITEQTINVSANVNCQGYTLTLVDHLGNTIGTPASYHEGDIIDAPADPAADACSQNYTFVGWSETAVEYGSLVYNQVVFPYTMPNHDVTLYPVYRINDTEDYHRVTSDLGAENWAGDYLIAFNNATFADGRTSTLGEVDMSEAIVNDAIPENVGDVNSISLITVDRGYVLKTKDLSKPYVYLRGGGTSTATTDNITTADDHPLSVTFKNESDIVITNPQNDKGYALMYSASSNCFGFYKAGLAIYLYKKSPLYTSSLICGEISVENDNVVVTSTKDQKVKVIVPIKVTSSFDGAVAIKGTGESTFSVTSLNDVAVNSDETINLELTYSPSKYDYLDNETITLNASNGATTTFQVKGRSLPESFAIVAKVGEMWYALPSQGLNSTTPPKAYPIEVDDVVDPAKVTAVPANADWSLRQVHANRYEANGHNLVFMNNESPAKALNASVDYNYLLTDAQYDNYYVTNPGLYEWTPTTSDLETYQLTNVHRAGSKLNIAVYTLFGVHANDVATADIRFLPIQSRYTQLAAQVVEWKENSLLIMYNGNPATEASVSINGGAAQTTSLSGNGVQKDIAIYELAAEGLLDNPGKELKITIGSEQLLLSIPYIININESKVDKNILPGTKVMERQSVAKVSDLVILNGGNLTADGTKTNYYKFRNVTIYGGGKLIVPAGKGFGAYSLTMRVGAVENGEYAYTYPQLDLNGTINNGDINLDILTTNDIYYPFSVPYAVTLTDIHYPVEIYGSNVKSTNKGSYLISYYDGAARATGSTGWKDVEEQGMTTLAPNTGYSIWGIPRKVSVNGATSSRQKFGIHRIPMKSSANAVMDKETANQSVEISAHPATRDNDRGWNFIGNPYLVQHGGLDSDNQAIHMGLLEKEMKDGKWTGGWVFNNEQVRYVTQTNDCLNYTSTPVANATIPAFSAFFIQAAQTGAIAFTSPNVAAAQSLTARRSDENKEITTGIILSGEKHSDRTGLLIADKFTEAYEFNADLSKFDNQDMNLYTISPNGKLAFMAINEELAKQTIPLGYSVSADGMYTIAFDEQRYNRNDIYALYLIDYDRNETTNLLHLDYHFYSDSGASAERFALQVAFAPSTTTDVEYTQVGDILLSREGNTLRLDNLPSNATVTIYDAVGHLIEQHSPSQYLQVNLPTGYYLMHIANKQDAVVIDTFIP